MTKILFFIETLSGGGAEKVLRTLVNHMDREKFDITVMTVWPEDESQYLAEHIHYRSLYSCDSQLNRLRYRLEAALGVCYRLHIRGCFDVEVAYLECGSTKIMSGSTNRNAVKLAWVHCDLKQKSSDTKAFVRKSSPWYAKFHKVVCVSENVRQSFVELFGDTPEAIVMYNAVDEQEIIRKAQQPSAAKNDSLTLLSAGRLCAQKGYDRLLRVHARLIREGICHDLAILGEGPDREKLERFITENALQDSVKLLGFQQNPYPYYRDADVLVCSSRFEGFSTFVTEAVILGKAVISTDCTGMRELLGDSEYGLVVENEEDALYRGIKEMLLREDLRQKYRLMAAQRAELFRLKTSVKKTEDFFLSMLEKI